MSQADSTNSTPMPAEATRRRFLSHAAGVAAGGTVLALAAIPPAPALAAPTGLADPVFSLIEAHRTAVEAHYSAVTEQDRREAILIDEGAGLCPFVAIADGGRPIVAYSHEQIDAYNYSSKRIKTRAHAALDAALERNAAVMGDAGRVTGSACEAETEAFEELLSTPPASMAGVRGLLAYVLREVDDIHHRLGDPAVAALTSIEDALDALLLSN
jgi:hypothetical protein